jgi:hypothetical protein
VSEKEWRKRVVKNVNRKQRRKNVKKEEIKFEIEMLKECERQQPFM